MIIYSTKITGNNVATVTVNVTDDGDGTLEVSKSSTDTTTANVDATFTNAEYRKIEVDKKWFQGSVADENDITSTINNASLKAKLSAVGWDGKDVDGNTVTVEVTLPNGTDWTASWDKLPK